MATQGRPQAIRGTAPKAPSHNDVELDLEILILLNWIMLSRGIYNLTGMYDAWLSLDRWTESIAHKVKRKKKTPDHSRKQIWRSVFDPPVTGLPPSDFVCLPPWIFEYN